MATLYNPGRERPVRKYVLWWFIFLHLASAPSMWYTVANFDWRTVLTAVVLFVACHLSITAGVHRMYSHRTFEWTLPYEIAVLIFFSATFQGSARWWATRHREHHQFEDTERDPYTTKHGFWWAHWLWVLHDPGYIEPHRVPKNLRNNSLLDWQEKNWLVLGALAGFILPAAICALWGDWLGGILVGSFLRLVMQYHFTFAINSVAHRFGRFRYVRVGTARTQAHWIFLPAFTVGEATSHERHHLAPDDYRIDPRWWALDVGKWYIWTCSKVGLVSDLETVSEEEVRARAARKADRQAA